MYRLIILLTLIIFAIGCSTKDEAVNNTITSPDARTWDPNSVCIEICDTSRADTCVDEICLCGANPECTEGRCIYGRCINKDNMPCVTQRQCQETRGERFSCINNACIAVCEFDSECPGGYFCVESRCTFVECVPEDCDGIDNDCDDVVDESDSGGPLATWCYSGSDLMSIQPPCRQGVQVCSAGSWGDCIGEVAPIPEQGLLNCDGVDNDCDGCVDGVLIEDLCHSRMPVTFDIMYGIDDSGSMSGTIAATISATGMFSASFSSNPNFRFGVALIPGETANHYNVISNLTDFSSFQRTLSTVSVGPGSWEPQWDFVYEVGTGELPLAWRPGSVRIIIIFTDERGQSRRTRRGLSDVTETDMCNSLAHGEVLAVVTQPRFYEDWDECAILFELTTDVPTMVANLNTIINDPCR